jgi:hypothetical protein
LIHVSILLFVDPYLFSTEISSLEIPPSINTALLGPFDGGRSCRVRGGALPYIIIGGVRWKVESRTLKFARKARMAYGNQSRPFGKAWRTVNLLPIIASREVGMSQEKTSALT